MRTIDTNRTNMVTAVITFCDADTAATNGIPAFATAMTALKAKMAVINGYNQIGNGDTSGVTADTNVLKSAMIDLAFKCARGTLAYANATGNNALKALVDYTFSDLQGFKNEDVDDTCQEIHDAANDNAADVLDYGVTAIDITDLNSSIQLYRAASGNPRYAVVQRSQAKKEVIRLVREVLDESLAGQMDIMVDILKNSNRLFWEGYKQARTILDIGSTTAKVRGVIITIDDNVSVPLSNVKFTIYETGTTTVVKQVITDAEGKYNAPQLPAGDYDFKWELQGYKPVTENNVHISAGKELKRDITLKPGGGRATLEADVPATSIANIPVNNLNITEESTMRLEVTGSTLRFYASASNVGAPGAQYFDVAPGQIFTKTIIEWANVFGFDEEIEDFLNVQNTGAVQGHYKMKWENLGA